MTYIEFFEKHSVENLCACLVNCPDRVILIGDNYKQMSRHSERYKIIFRERGKDIEFICKSINKYNISGMVDTISEIINTYDDCAFGLTGGDDLFLVAMGIVFERYKEKNIQMHRFNVRNNTIVDCDLDGKFLPQEELPVLSIWENIYSHGGDIIDDPSREDTTPHWTWDDGLQYDINLMWDICKRNTRNWNAQIGIFGIAEQLSDKNEDSMKIEAAVSDIKRQLYNQNAGYVSHPYIFHELQVAGLIEEYECNEQKISVVFKNEQIKRCLTKAGQALEMKVFLEAMLAKASADEYVYNDVMNGVCIDWDGEIHVEDEGYDTENEIDVMMMHGMVPVFVSCKNGRVEIDELYKLNTVATRFGGKYAKKVLVASSLDKYSDYSHYLRQRAQDMQIRIVDDIVDMSDDELRDTIQTFWLN